MMACTASPGQLFAAPFAVLGSIGVLGQTLNFYETLQSYGVESLTFRSGRAKAPVTSTSEITREGLAVMQDMLDDVHRAFQRHVAEARPQLAARIHDVATGEIWLGHDALAEGLIDGITSRYVLRPYRRKPDGWSPVGPRWRMRFSPFLFCRFLLTLAAMNTYKTPCAMANEY